MEEKVTLNELYYLVLEFFGDRVSKPYINSERQEMTCILYDSFVFKCEIDNRYGTFGGGILLDSSHVVTRFFGEQISLNSDKISILNSLKIIDDYCRLRLPDKFLEKYDRN